MAFNYQAIINSINNFAAKYGLTMYAYTPNFKGVIEALDNLQNIQFTVEDGTIVNADVNANAAIAGTKIDPDFGSQTIETTGVFSAADGAAATPSITFTGDTNTGIYRPGADQLAISTNGTGRLFVDASGNVGLNAASTGAISIGIPVLEVKGNSASQTDRSGGIRLTRYDGIVGADFYNADGATYIESKSTYPLLFSTNGSERVRIDSSGNVGIGISSPSSLLDVNGSAKFAGAISVDGGVSNENSSYGPGYLIQNRSLGARNLWTGQLNGSTTSTILADGSATFDGSVGIGTTSPSAELSFGNTTDTVGSDVSKIQIYNNGSGVIYGLGVSSQQFNYRAGINTDAHVWYAGTTERMRIDGSGRLMVGTTTEQTARLVVNGSAGSGDDGINVISGSTTVGSKAAIFFSPSTSGSFSTGSAIKTERVSPDGSDLQFYTCTALGNAATERMRITSSGNVGIGTSSPATQLDVRGALNTGGYAYMTGDANTNGSPLGRFGFYNTNASASANPLRAYITSTRQNSAWGADLQFFTSQGTSAATSKLIIDEYGQVGIGTASPGGVLHVNGSGEVAIIGSSSRKLYFRPDGGGVMLATGASQTGNGFYFSESSNYIYAQTNTLERMRIDSSGRLLVGTSSALSSGVNDKLQIAAASATGVSTIQGIYSFNTGGGIASLNLSRSNSNTLGVNTLVASGQTLGSVNFAGADGSTYLNAARIIAEVDGTPGANDMPGRLVFSTTADGASSPTERMRIDNEGATTITSPSTTNAALLVKSTGTTNFQRGIVIDFSNRTPNDANSYFLNATDSTNAKAILYSNGGLHNYQSNDANLCDEREKKNIETLDSTWGCLKSWELKKFHYNEDDDTDNKRYGVIAQQVEQYCPELITNWVKQKAEDAVIDDDGNVIAPAVEEVSRMAVKEQQMMWMAIKSLQEAQVRIEALEAEVAALKAQ